MLLLTIICVLVVVLSCVQIYRRRHMYAFANKCSKLPCWPIIGNSLQLNADAREVVKLLEIALKDFYRERLVIWLFTKPLLLIQTPEDARAVLNSRQCIEKHDYYNIIHLLFGQGLFTAKPETWKIHRKMLVPAFNKSLLVSYVPLFAERAQEFACELLTPSSDGRPFDILPLLSSFALRIFCETAMGISIKNDDKEQQEYVNCIDRLKEVIVERMFTTRSIGFYLGKWAVDSKVRRDLNFMENFTKKVIRAKKIEMEERGENVLENDSTRRLSFLELIYKLTDLSAFSETECCDEVTTFLFAGSDTTSATVGFVMLVLGMCADIQRLVHKELNEIFSDRNNDAPVELSDLPKMEYLERVIKETMRLFPVAAMISRKCHGDVKLDDGLTIPAGVDPCVVIYNLHRDPKSWPDPLKFDPDRFLPDEVQKRHPYSYIPFSAGMRNCIGGAFAMMSMKITIATLLRLYEVQIPPNSPKTPGELEVEMYVVTRPVGGAVIQLQPRNNNNYYYYNNNNKYSSKTILNI